MLKYRNNIKKKQKTKGNVHCLKKPKKCGF